MPADPIVWTDEAQPGKMKHSFTGLRHTFPNRAVHYLIMDCIIPIRIPVPALTAIGIASAGWGLWSRLRGRVATEQIPLVKDFPNLHRDYSAVFAEHMESAGLNRVAVAAELNAFVKAYELLQGGNLPVPGAKSSELVDLAVKVRRWVNASFRDQHLHAANSNNVNHQAFTAYLYRRATQLLKEGEFGMTRFAESAAEAIQDHVDVMFQTQLVTQE